MTAEKIREAIKSQPFRAFRMHMGGGRSVVVPQPEWASVNPTGRIMVVFGPKGEMEIIDVVMIQSIELLPERRSGGRRKAG